MNIVLGPSERDPLEYHWQDEADKFPPSEHEWHFWVVGIPTGFVLCMADSVFERPKACIGKHSINLVHVTIQKDLVNCEACLELIHS